MNLRLNVCSRAPFKLAPFPQPSLGSGCSYEGQPCCTATPHGTKSQAVQRIQGHCFCATGLQWRPWGWYSRSPEQPAAICFAYRACNVTFSLQTSFWKHWDLSVSAQLPRCCPGPAGWLSGWRCHSLQRETPQLCSQGQIHWSSAWPCGRVAAGGSADPRSDGG